MRAMRPRSGAQGRKGWACRWQIGNDRQPCRGGSAARGASARCCSVMKTEITVVAGKLSLRTLRQIASGSVFVVLDAATLPAIRASRSAVQQAVDHGAPAYGIHTGFGKLAKTHIAHDQLERLQTHLVRSHAA